MQDLIGKLGWDVFAGKWQYIAGAVGVLYLVGMLLPSIKQLIMNALASGPRMTSKPRAALLGVGVVMLVIASLGAGYAVMPPKIVEKEVVRTVEVVKEVVRVVKVPDMGQVGEVKSQLQEMGEKLVAAETRAADAATRANAAEAGWRKANEERDQEADERRKVEYEISSLRESLRRKTPKTSSSFVAEMEDLMGRVDGTHAAHVISDRLRDRNRFKDSSQMYQQFQHVNPNIGGDFEGNVVRVWYHGRCGICATNLQLREKVDETYRKYSEAKAIGN